MLRQEKLTQSTSRPALRLVKTNTLSRDEWLEMRRQGIGSSDAAAAVGLNPYQSQLELWMQKTGREDRLPKIDPDDDTHPVYWGNVLEPIVANAYAKRTGFRVRRIHAILQHPDPDLPWMLANIDREVMGAGEVQILECKTAGEHGAKLWRHGVPEYVQLQVQHQLAVTGKKAADVCVLVCGQELRIHRIERDDALIHTLILLERQFWEYVRNDTPPPADGSDSAARALQGLFPLDNGTTLNWQGDPELNAVFSELLEVRSEMEEREQREAELKQRIQQNMAEATKALFARGSVTWKRSKDSVGVDTTKILKEHPEFATRYPLIRPGSRRFLLQKHTAAHQD
jgi:putative phage-type endonuclease